jgi:hypothetical protein
VQFNNSIQFDWINKHTISLWLYKSPRRSRHVVTCSRQSVSCLQTVEVQGCLFTSVTSVHCRTLLGISFLLNLPEWVYGYISRFSSAKQIDNISSREPFLWQRNSLLGCIRHGEKSECMHRWTRWTFPIIHIKLFFVFWFQCDLFFDKLNMCQEWVTSLLDHSVYNKICFTQKISRVLSDTSFSGTSLFRAFVNQHLGPFLLIHPFPPHETWEQAQTEALTKRSVRFKIHFWR